MSGYIALWIIGRRSADTLDLHGDGVNGQEWGGGQQVGSSQEKGGSLDQEV